MKYCIRCDQDKPLIDFYTRRRDGLPLSYCKRCANTEAVERQQRNKRLAVEYLGGKCMKCGIVGDPIIFDFHHREPNKKDFNLSKSRGRSLAGIKHELDKCDLLCAICHRLVHKEMNGWSEPIKEYAAKQKSLFDIPQPVIKIAYEPPTKIQWPLAEDLERIIWKKPTKLLSNDFGVSDSAIAKRCKKYGISKPPRGYWTLIDLGYTKEQALEKLSKSSP